MLKPIETRYKGYRFRSRLEARWAVFMDTLGIRYEYEPEGFELGGGLRYLPDFWLPGQRCWVEVKASEPDNTEEAKARALVQATERPIFIVSALEMPVPTGQSVYDPVLNSHIGFVPNRWFEDDPHSSDTGVTRLGDCCWIVCAACSALSIGSPAFMYFTQMLAHGGRGDCDHMEFRSGGKIADAFEEARGARFEFGR